MTYDPKEVARLIGETREDDARMTQGTWRMHGGWILSWPHDEEYGSTVASLHLMQSNVLCDKSEDNGPGIARLRNNARALADQLEAQQREIERVTAERDGAVTGAFTAGQQSGAEETRLRAEVERMRVHVDSLMESANKTHHEIDQLRAYNVQLTDANVGFQTEVERMRPVVRAAERDVEEYSSMIEAERARDKLASAVDAYRAAKEKL